MALRLTVGRYVLITPSLKGLILPHLESTWENPHTSRPFSFYNKYKYFVFMFNRSSRRSSERDRYDDYDDYDNKR